MTDIDQQIQTLAEATGVDMATVRHFAEAIARRVSVEGMSVRDAVIDYSASVQAMTERALQGADAWHNDRQHGSDSQTGQAYREFMGMVLDMAEQSDGGGRG